MGIRVVQRAFAPPSPHLYVPGGPGRTCRDRAKQNRKALLFGCESAPLDVKYDTKSGQAISRSAETVSQNKMERLESSTESTWSPDFKQKLAKLKESQLIQDSTRTPAAPSTTLTPQQCDCSASGGGDESNASLEQQQQQHLTNGIDETRESDVGNQRVIVTGATPVEGEKEMPGKDGDGETAEDEQSIADHYHTLCGSKRPSLAAYLAGVPAPKAFAEKFYLLSDGKVWLTASLDKAIYSHGEEVHVTVQIRNNSNKTIKRIKIFVVQHVDVCMFSNGKFKNVVSMLNPKEDCPIHSGTSFEKTYSLIPLKGTTKNWIALEESYNKSGTSLASTVTSTIHNPDDRNVFAIYVSYYVKVKLMVSMMGGEVSLKLPFTLMHTCDDLEYNTETLTKVAPQAMSLAPATDVRLELKAPPSPEAVVKPEKDGT